MMVFFDAGLTILAVPKTGTTALAGALRHRADITFARKRKHITARAYYRHFAKGLSSAWNADLSTLAIMRAPIDQLRSWYAYRSRLPKSDPRSTRGITFDHFIKHALETSPPPFARVGSQFRFLTNAKGKVLVDHLFSYDRPDLLLAFLEQRFDTTIALARENVSPTRDAPLSSTCESALRRVRAREFALFDELTSAGGYLGPDTTVLATSRDNAGTSNAAAPNNPSDTAKNDTRNPNSSAKPPIKGGPKKKAA